MAGKIKRRAQNRMLGKGMAMGADLYVTKPFSTRELMDQMRALLAG